MRLSIVAAACGVSLALVGCYAARDASAVPSGLGQSSGAGYGVRGHIQFPPRGTQYAGMLKWFADGKMPGPEPRWFMKRWYHDFAHRGRLTTVKHNVGGTAALWAVTEPGYLLGLSTTGHKYFGLSLYDNNCYIGGGMKVDSAGNAWVACSSWYNGKTYYGSAEEFDHSGNVLNSWKGGCPANVPGCYDWQAFADDVAFDGQGGAYVADVVAGWCSSYPSCNFVNAAGFEYFSSPSAQPVFANVYGTQPPGCTSNCVSVNSIYSFDVDSSGNIWTSFLGCPGYTQYLCMYGIAEVTGVSSGNPTFNVVVPAGALPGTDNSGPTIYIAGNTATVTVGNPWYRTVYQYALPITPSSQPTILGVTQQNTELCGNPAGGGFNASGTTFAIGDLCGWIDTLSGGKAGVISNLNLIGAVSAGYAPSNK